MSSTQFERAYALFNRATDLAPEDRLPYLQRECADEPETLRAVAELLEIDDALPETFLANSPHVEEIIPAQIGPFHVVREVGAGGMGVVYEAEQTQPRRRVAVKVMRAGVVTEELLKRFEREARVLAQLQHPGIAHIYATGTAELGGQSCPYFAMEYVEGQPLDTDLQRRDRSTFERLELFTKICDAVDHAHERSVVHRDLKPANILIDSSGQPKILDFGVARMLGADQPGATLQTRTGQIVGTVGYMSPEQLGGDVHRVDARSDVYALGVVLFQMLADRLPFDLRGKPIAEVARVVQDEEPTRIGSIDQRWRGDVDTIITKALEKVPDQRYSSAAALASDVRRFLNDEPIVARTPSFWYRTSKLARRNKGLVTGLALTFLTLIIGLVVSTSALVTANEERAVAEQQRRTAEAVTRFLADMIGEFNPDRQGRDVTLRKVLEESEQTIDTRFAKEPLVRASLHSTLARAYLQLGDYELAESHGRPALETSVAELGEDDPRTLAARHTLGSILYFAGDYPGARQEALASVEGYRRIGRTDSLDLADAMSTLGLVETRLVHNQDAESWLLEAKKIYDAEVDPNSLEALRVVSRIAVLYSRMERYEEAEPMFLDLIDRARRHLGPEHPEVALAVSNLAAQYNRTERVDEAISLMKEALRIQRNVLGESHSKTLITLNNLAVAHWRQSDLPTSVKLLREGMATAEETYGEASPSGLMLLHSLGLLLMHSKRFDESEIALTRNLELHYQLHDEKDLPALLALVSLMKLRRAQERPADAADLARTLLSRLEASEHVPTSKRCAIRKVIAGVFAKNGEPKEAERVRLGTERQCGRD